MSEVSEKEKAKAWDIVSKNVEWSENGEVGTHDRYTLRIQADATDGNWYWSVDVPMTHGELSEHGGPCSSPSEARFEAERIARANVLTETAQALWYYGELR